MVPQEIPDWDSEHRARSFDYWALPLVAPKVIKQTKISGSNLHNSYGSFSVGRDPPRDTHMCIALTHKHTCKYICIYMLPYLYRHQWTCTTHRHREIKKETPPLGANERAKLAWLTLFCFHYSLSPRERVFGLDNISRTHQCATDSGLVALCRHSPLRTIRDAPYARSLR